jgi:hypothetical protein
MKQYPVQCLSNYLPTARFISPIHSFLCAAVVVIGTLPVKAQKKQKDDFTLVKQKGMVAIYERWITMPKSNPPVKAREIKGEFTFNNSIYAALALIKDEKKIKQWQDLVSECKVYLKPDTTTWLEYSYFDIPWPVNDQDHFIEYKLHEKKPGHVLFITFETKSNDALAPPRENVTRMSLAGSWTFEQITPKKTRATYRILSKPAKIPTFVTDPVIRNNMITTLEEFIALLEK